ncbi:hypothetical protein C1Y63_02485 [Corynebacterium sp. 13CS0277]|uniref:hypothetical protein n=1 Tax=Corynebacterium sp. 13CS0277 TaxID=2071994 RepID=UPI000D047D82|nr:hypothetical protein [Corynebacterium sp. 13CS0277]PRQ12197.1 hypothetical protein C1Y63_02485 [Corynebacterium sp. 13CS0277]
MPQQSSPGSLPLYLRRSPLVPLGALALVLGSFKAFPSSWFVLPGWWGFLASGDPYVVGLMALSGALGLLLVGLSARYAAELSWWVPVRARRTVAAVAWLVGLITGIAIVLHAPGSSENLPSTDSWYWLGVPNAIAVGVLMGVGLRQRLLPTCVAVLAYVPITAVVGALAGVSGAVGVSVPLVFGVGHAAVQASVLVVFAVCLWLVEFIDVDADRGPLWAMLVVVAGAIGGVFGVMRRAEQMAAPGAAGGSLLAELAVTLAAALVLAGLSRLQQMYAARTRVPLEPVPLGTATAPAPEV